ncbi:MAG: F-type H+-transporting ATPase subunit epsilon [Flavobacteriaceae bacterium]|jgi:F-type H+-transporting ATPase subunit epsilon
MIHLSIATIEQEVFRGEVKEISLATIAGELTILQNHIPLVVPLVVGEMRIRRENEEDMVFALSGGILEVREGSEVVVLADHSENIETLDKKISEQKYESLKKELEEGTYDKDALADIEKIMQRHMNRISLLDKYKK